MTDNWLSGWRGRSGSLLAAMAILLLSATLVGGAVVAGPVHAKAPKRSGASRDEPLRPGIATGAFGLDLMRAYGPGNVVLSPDSVAAALAMTGSGGVGRTAREIARTLHLKGPSTFAAFGRLQRGIVGRYAAAKAAGPEAPTLEIANGVFLQQGLPFRPAYVNGVQRRFGASVQAVDFDGDPEGALGAINGWVSERTEGLIPKILGQLPPEMALALANAIYLHADWEHRFKPSATGPGTFHAATGKVDVDFMHQTELLPFDAGPGYKAVALPYRSSTLSLLVVLPVQQRLGSLLHRLDGRGLARISRRLSSRPVILGLPRFHVKTDVGLNGPLRKLGMRTAFSEAADFSRIANAVGLKVDFVKHAADLAVNEAGTVAAAATVVGVTRTAADRPPRDAVTFNANRPFLFFLRDDRTGAVLFAGRLVNPAPAGA